MKQRSYKINLDRIGITASMLCAIHCAVLPFIITVLPIWGMGFLANEAVEITMIAVSLIIGIWSLSSAYRKQHRRMMPILVLIAGFACIALGHFSGIEPLEPILIPIGGFTIAAAHYINLKMLKSCPLGHQ
ncbi:MerC domain-containing protein [Pedobacter sp. KBS0701]|uniref:MerC domain-containing protein n=1 Tax=Pedobacter sp. KBS0701 TaxID=2578106 RepID=UPI00110DAD02|nr:MerC domain-containing protein [Pedobacter sp. KBS0701]QDW23605.1 MerC domain-containing protein [Pedobacter sp. KBS0701]